MWLNSTLHFGLRGRHEHVQMTWGDMELKTDGSGCEYVVFHERATKLSKDQLEMSELLHQECTLQVMSFICYVSATTHILILLSLLHFLSISL